MWLCPSCYQLTGFFSLWSFYKFTLSHISHYHISIVDFLNKNILVGVEDLTTFFFPSQLWMVFSQYQAAWLVVEDIHHPVQVHHTVVVNHDCGQVREAWLSHRWTQMCFDGSESRLALLIIFIFFSSVSCPRKEKCCNWWRKFFFKNHSQKLFVNASTKIALLRQICLSVLKLLSAVADVTGTVRKMAMRRCRLGKNRLLQARRASASVSGMLPRKNVWCYEKFDLYK